MSPELQRSDTLAAGLRVRAVFVWKRVHGVEAAGAACLCWKMSIVVCGSRLHQVDVSCCQRVQTAEFHFLWIHRVEQSAVCYTF